jgi:4-cresol dehydrogenase (hydroxylating) cytochrome subunit
MKANLNGIAGALLLASVLLGSADAWAGPWRDGGQVYEKVCGHCHEAGVGPVIKGRNLPMAYIERVVRYGNRAMPSFRPSEIDAVALNDVARLVSGSATVAAKQGQ